MSGSNYKAADKNSLLLISYYFYQKNNKKQIFVVCVYQIIQFVNKHLEFLIKINKNFLKHLKEYKVETLSNLLLQCCSLCQKSIVAVYLHPSAHCI